MMKKEGSLFTKNIGLVALVFFILVGCDRDLSDDAEIAGFAPTAEIFTESFGGGIRSWEPYGDSKFDVFTADDQVAFLGNVSMRFDVPSVGDPEGPYAGGIFRDTAPRDLSGFDALTFYAKATKAATIDEIGFGEDFGANRFLVAANNLPLTTAWRKYIIPIPDAAKLTAETGMLRFAEGPEDGDGYTFWLDEVRFEKLGTIAQQRPSILQGEDRVEQTFIGAGTQINALQYTANLPSGQDITLNVAPGYFDFASSNEAVASVSETGNVTVSGAGETIVTATLAGNTVAGSLTIQSLGEFVGAPIPTRDASNVISIFSDAYTNVPVDFFNGFFAPFQTTLGQDDISINGDNIIKYTELNFVASEFKNPTINANEMTHLHVDIQVENTIMPGDFIRLQLGDFGPNAVFDGGGDDSNGSYTIQTSQLSTGTWLSFDIPLASFTGLTNRANLAQLFFITDGTNPNLAGNITDILVDNIYLYKIPSEPGTPSPTPTFPQSSVISLFSDAYNDVNVDTWRTPWSSGATVFTDEVLAGNPVKKYATLGFAGIETTSQTVDASAMTHVSFDVWSSTFTQFNLKIVDFGPDNAFAGGDDTEHEIVISNPPTVQWVTYDIPLSDFTGLTNRSNLAQYIIVAQPFEGADVFIDNFYFHN